MSYNLEFMIQSPSINKLTLLVLERNTKNQVKLENINQIYKDIGYKFQSLGQLFLIVQFSQLWEWASDKIW